MEGTTFASDVKTLPFNVTDLDVTVEEGFTFKWQGREIESGRITVMLGKPGSHGVIDYDAGTVSVEFRVKIVLSELAELLDDIGADTDLAAPIDAIIRSEGAVFADNHSLRLAGKAEIGAHKFFDPSPKVEILAPTRCEPSSHGRSAAEIQQALLRGEPVTWNFNPTERRVVIEMPEKLGGETCTLCLAGSYTLTAANPQTASS
jgi:hypothetical protein